MTSFSRAGQALPSSKNSDGVTPQIFADIEQPLQRRQGALVFNFVDIRIVLPYPEISVRRMSYAASFGQNSLDENSKAEIARRIAAIERFG